jgi:N12 class adenine-specific DNA methylase
VERLGFKGGSTLEPAGGIGHFFGLMPKGLKDNSRLFGVELDSISGRIFKKLYPQARIQVTGFESAKGLNDNSFDLIVSNFPFGDYPVTDKKHPDYSGWHIHNYFFARAVDALRPGGMLAAITSRYTMDSLDAKVRKYIQNRADLVGAIRLPDNAFLKNAGTEVVTDILIFRKKDASRLPFNHPFNSVMDIEIGKEKVPINEYFVANPDMILGSNSLAGSMYAKNTYTVTAKAGDILANQLDEAIKKLPENIYGEGAVQPPTTEEEIAAYGEKEGTLKEKEGRFYVIEQGTYKPVEWQGDRKKLKKAGEYLKIKAAKQKLVTLSLSEDATDAEIAQAQKALNTVYDRFVSAYGHINANANKFLHDDIEFIDVSALEDVRYEFDPKTHKKIQLVEKADIFRKRTIYPFREPTSAEDIRDAINISMIYRSTIDIDYLASLLNMDKETARLQAIEKGLAFENPNTGLLEAPAEYLSGDVKTKLEIAELRAAENPIYKSNVEALKGVQPKDLTIEEISFRLGAPWIPRDVIEKFAKDELGVTLAARIVMTGDQSKWIIDERAGSYNAKNSSTWAAHNITGVDMLKASLNLKNVVVEDRVAAPELVSGYRMVKNPEKTIEAQDVQKRLKAEFINYVKGNADLAVKLEDVYNREKNRFVMREYPIPDIEHFPLASTEVKLRTTQKKGVGRGLQSSTVFAHAVGTGKTYLYITLAMELKRIRAANKAMIVVQPSTIASYQNSIKKLYPTAKALIPNDKQRKAEYRQRTMSQIATGDYDIIVVPHDWFDMLPVNPEREAAFIREQIGELEDQIIANADDRITRKELEKIKEKKEEKLGKLLASKKDKVVFFESLGVDALFVDEAHRYKRSEFYTQMGNVKGIDKASSQRSMSLLLKTQFINEKTGYKNIFLATGTPISNTLAEMWTLMRYVRPDLLKEYGIEQFDSFATIFANTKLEHEMTATGDFKIVERFSQYVNGGELLTMWRTFADIVLKEDIADQLNLPTIKGGKPELKLIPRSALIERLILQIKRERIAWENLSGREKREQRHVPLVLYGRAKQVAIDPRLINSSLPDDPGSKVNAVVNDVYETWKQTVAEKSTQLVFCDSYQSADGKFNVYHEIKKKLSMRGIPGHEIQIYNEIKNDAAKASFIADFNEGKIRVALGSTGTLGTGTNVQERLIALRHIDVPPRPMDFEQRNGRGERSGNLHKEINIVVYGVQKTLDAVGFQILLIKQKFINQLMRGDIKARTFDDPFSTDQASFEDMMAALSGNPLIKRRFELETRVKELSTLKSAYLRKQRKLQTDIKNKEDYVLYLERKAKRAAEELGNLKENFPKGITELTYEGKTYAGDDVKKGAEKLVDSIDRTLEKNHKKGVYDAIQDTVTINGQEVNIEAQPDISITTGEFNQINRWNFGYGEIEGYWSEKKRPVLLFGGTFTTGSGLVQSFEGAIRRADEQVARFNGEIEKEQKNLADLKKDKDKPFEYEGEIAEKGQELQDVTKELEKSADEDATAIKGQPQEQPPDIEEEPPDTAVNLYSGLPLPELVKLMKDIRKSVFSSALYPDMTEAEALASIPFYWAQRHPEFKKVWDIEEKREEGRRTLLKEFLMSPTKKRAGEHHEFLNLPPKKAEELFKVMVESDARNRLFTVEQLKQKGMDESQLIAYYAWSRTMENVWNRLVDLGEEITLRPYEDKPYYNALRAVYREEKSIDDAVQGMDEVQEAELRQAIRRLKPIKTTIKKLREQMGKVNYYVPRYRTVGNWTIRGYESNEPDAKVVFMKRARNRFELKILENKAKKKYPRVVSQYEPQTPEFIYQEITDVALQQFIDKALESAKKRKKIDPEDADAVREALMKAITDELNIRGFGQHKIGRVRERVIEGYQTTGGKEILIRYLSGAAGYITKVDSSWKFAKALSEIDLKKKAVLYRETETYIKDMLRNQQKADKISALGRSIAFTYYLAGNLKFAAVQMSQNFATGIPKLSQYTKQPDVKYMRAMKDVTFHRNITPEEQKALDESFNKGITEGQFTKEAALSAKSQLSKSLAKAVDIISWPSSGMEEFNRKSAFLAMFRVARKEMKLSYPDAIEKATEFVYYVHFKYGKSNLPTVARGGTVAHAALRTAYTFRAYTHNYILMLLDAAKKDAAGRRKLKIIGRSLAYLFLMGGFVSLPFLDDILDYLERKSGYNFRSEMRQRLRTWGGEYLQRFGMEGLAAVLGVDISGSLKTGVPFLSDTPINDIYGVYGNIGKKAEQSVDALLRGEYARAVEMGAPTFIENPLKAYRMWSEQATTPKGKLLFDEKGRPLMLSGPEAAGQAIGFRPERVAVGSKERRTYMNIKQWASDERDSIFTDARLAKTPADWNKIMKRIQNYNFKVLRYKGAIPLITGQMVRRGIKPRPDKSFMQYEAGLEDQGL